MRRLPALVIAVVLGSTVAAQDDVVRRIIDEARNGSRVMDHLDHLTNRIGPRLTASQNLQKACEWARETFESFGLKPARLVPWGEFPVGFDRGPSSGRMVAPEEKPLRFGTNAWTAGTKGAARGRAVLAPTSDEELTGAASRLAGAWVVEAKSGGLDAEFRKRRDEAFEKAGILGVVRGVRGELIVTSGNWRVDPEKLPARVQIQLLGVDHADIVERLSAGTEVVLEFDIANRFRKGPIPLVNVVADIRGTEKPDEYVIVGGHIDSWDGATGTTDNGTGTATTLEAARLLMAAKARPKRTIRFMLWSGEEQGLLGSRGYIKEHGDELPRISAVLVHDGGTNYVSGINATKAMLADFETVFAPLRDLDPDMPFKIREVKGLPVGIGSDHDSFLRSGVPGFFWNQSGRAVYNHTHHTQFDTYDAAITEYQVHTSIVAAVGALGIANLDHLVSREGMLSAEGGGRPFAGMRGRRLGVVFGDGMTVEEVMDETPAAKAGVRPGDRLLRVNGQAIAGQDELRSLLRESRGDVKIAVRRGEADVEMVVSFPEAPAESRPGPPR